MNWQKFLGTRKTIFVFLSIRWEFEKTKLLLYINVNRLTMALIDLMHIFKIQTIAVFLFEKLFFQERNFFLTLKIVDYAIT